MSQLVVTKQNIKKVASSDLLQRYNYLTRVLSKKNTIHPELYSLYLEEQEIIKDVIIRRGKSHLINTQMHIPGLEPPQKENYTLIVKKQLEAFYKVEQRKERLHKLLSKGIELIFPSNTASYGNMSGITSGYSEFKSKTEESVVKREERGIRRRGELVAELREIDQEMEEMEQALEGLSREGLEYIERMHFTNKKKLAFEVREEMGVGKTKFHEIQRKAYLHIAESLRIL